MKYAMVQPTPFDKERIRKQEHKLRVKLGKKIVNAINCRAADVIAVLKVLVGLAVEALQKDGVFRIPKLVKLQAKPVPARGGQDADGRSARAARSGRFPALLRQ